MKPRGPSTQRLLKIAWDYPVYAAPAARPAEGTAVAEPRHALGREEAIEYLAGDDARPLLVVRECRYCNKTDDALLRPGIDNERTILLSRWFHCVKLPVAVIEPDHPFNALFPNDDAEHLFVSAADGSAKIPLESDTSRVQLWASMSDALAAAYAKDPGAAAKRIAGILDDLDRLDERLAGLERRRDDLLETSGKLDTRRLKKVEKEIDSARKELEKALGAIEKLSTIDLKPGAGTRGS